LSLIVLLLLLLLEALLLQVLCTCHRSYQQCQWYWPTDCCVPQQVTPASAAATVGPPAAAG
jgi:hypothetical protein